MAIFIQIQQGAWAGKRDQFWWREADGMQSRSKHQSGIEINVGQHIENYL
jgi:hypothetical protein